MDSEGLIMAILGLFFRPLWIVKKPGHYPELDKEEHWQRTLEHLNEKYAEGGYLHLLIPGSPNEAPLQALRSIIGDKQKLRQIFDAVYDKEG